MAFAVFGLGGLLLTVTVFPLINLLYRDRFRRATVAQWGVCQAWRFFIWMIVSLRFMDFDSQGEEILRGDCGTLIVANHPSLLDIVLIISMTERAQCVVKKGVWNNPFMRGVIKATNYIPNLGDSEHTMRECVAALKAGNNLVIFPEGSRTVPGSPVRLQRGFANIAIRAGAPIRLVTVCCDPPMLRKGEKWYKSPLSRPRYLVRVGERIDTAVTYRSDVPSRGARDLTARVTRHFEEVMAHEPA